MPQSPVTAVPRSVTAFLALAAFACLMALAAAGPARAEEAVAAPTENAIEKLVKNREFEKAILEVERLRAEAGQGGMADAASELWAGHAYSRQGQHDAAREQFQRVARRYPDDPAGREAAIEAAAALIRETGEDGDGKADSKKLALQAVTELQAVAQRHRQTDPATAARALYIAGNAYWIADQVEQAVAVWTDLSTLPDDDYAAKGLYRLATNASRELDNERAKALYTRCISEHAQASYAARCAKNLGRLSVVGTPAAPIVAETWAKGSPQDMEQFRGKVVLLWFFASWCPHCKETMPKMAELAERMKDKPFVIIGVTANTRGQTTAIAKAFVDDPQWAISYPVAVDLSGRTSEAYGAGSVPSAALVDKAGVIRWADHPTYLNDAMIETLLAE